MSAKSKNKKSQTCGIKPDLIVHIGSHKSGSTSVQEFSDQNREKLIDKGIYYASTKYMGNNYPDQHSFLAELIRSGDESFVRKFIQKSARSAMTDGCKYVFLSGEEFCKLNAEEIFRFRRSCGDVFGSLKAVLVLREMHEYAISNFKHFLRYSGSGDIVSLRSSIVWSPRETFLIWKSFFSEKIQLLSFEEIKSNLVSDFFKDVFGVKLDGTMHSNKSLDILTSAIYFLFAKDYNSKKLDEILYRYFEIFNSEFDLLEIDQGLSSSIFKLYDVDQWSIPGFPERALFDNSTESRKVMPPSKASKLCDQYISLFSEFRLYFSELAQQREI